MNREKMKLFTLAVIVLTGLALIPGTSEVYAGETCQIIKISMDKAGGGSKITIIPEKITIPVGTCTVWINFIKEREVNVSFRENAKECIVATNAATGFRDIKLETGEVCFLSHNLELGKTASLVWDKPGTYKYTLESPGATPGRLGAGSDPKTVLAEGVIEVK